MQNRNGVSIFHREGQNNGHLPRNNHLPNQLCDDVNEPTWVTEFEALKHQVERSLLQLTILRDLSYHLVGREEQANLLNLLLDRLNSVVDYHGALLAQTKPNKFTVLSCRGPGAKEDIIGQSLFTTESLRYQEILPHQKPIIISDTHHTSEQHHPFQELIISQAEKIFDSPRSLLALSMHFRYRTIGWLLLSHSKPGQYSTRHVDLVLPFANYMALVLGNHQIYMQARQLTATNERNRLAQELHDNVAQSLGYLNLQISGLNSLLANGQFIEAQTSLNELKQIVAETYTDVREEISHLRGNGASGSDFWDMLRRYIAKYKKFYGLNIQLVTEVEHTRLEFPTEVGQELVSIIQEALINIRKHAGVDTASIHFSKKNGYIYIVIEDKGKGFNLDQINRTSKAGFGLQIMHERVESIGGSLEINSTPGGGGTQVVIRLSRML